jgi:hypothetical protein
MGSEWTDEWVKGRERLKGLGPWDVVLGNHPNNTPGHLFKLTVEEADRDNGDPHPVVQGPADIDEWLDALLEVGRQKDQAPLHGHLRRGPTIADQLSPHLLTPR